MNETLLCDGHLDLEEFFFYCPNRECVATAGVDALVWIDRYPSGRWTEYRGFKISETSFAVIVEYIDPATGLPPRTNSIRGVFGTVADALIEIDYWRE